MLTPLADLRSAVGFLTRLPVRDTAPLTPARFARMAFWFPVVGLLVGGVLGGVRVGLDAVGVDPGPATLLALLAAILVTGGLHEDGLADCADALGAHTSRERKLEILRDSRVGTFGALAVAFVLLLPFAALAPLDGSEVLRAALVGHALGRWSTLPLARLLALLWHLADRWGKVGPDGTHVPLRLTHATLAQLVGAQRPSVTSALRGLEQRGLLRRLPEGGGFLLFGEPPGDPEQALAQPVATSAPVL